MKIIYLLGRGRSGSTLISHVLGCFYLSYGLLCFYAVGIAAAVVLGGPGNAGV